jgi:uncharacterized membrane protein (DUF485 family)
MVLDFAPSTLGLHFQSEMPKSFLVEVSRLHVIFYLSGVLVVKWVVESRTQMPTSSSLTLSLRLKDFITNCFVLFKVYIWYASWHYNIDKYLDEIKEQHTYYLDPSRVLKQKSCQKNDHFFAVDPKKPISIRIVMFSSGGFLTLMIGTLCL